MLFFVEELNGGIVDCRWIFVVRCDAASQFQPGGCHEGKIVRDMLEAVSGTQFRGGARKQAAILELQSYEYTLQEAVASLWYAMVQMAHLRMIYPQQDLPSCCWKMPSWLASRWGSGGRDENPQYFLGETLRNMMRETYVCCWAPLLFAGLMPGFMGISFFELKHVTVSWLVYQWSVMSGGRNKRVFPTYCGWKKSCSSW